jgi:glycerol uptake facilitator-like aquaporin
MFLDRRLPRTDLLLYWASQLLGGIAASLVLLVATSKHDVA